MLSCYMTFEAATTIYYVNQSLWLLFFFLFEATCNLSICRMFLDILYKSVLLRYYFQTLALLYRILEQNKNVTYCIVHLCKIITFKHFYYCNLLTRIRISILCILFICITKFLMLFVLCLSLNRKIFRFLLFNSK